MTPIQWIKDAIFWAAVVTIIIAGKVMYDWGYSKAETAWTAKYETLKSDFAAQRQKELDRQYAANLEAKRRETLRLEALVEENRQLSETVEDLLHEAELDPDANRVCLSDDSRMRINKVR